MRYIRWQSEEDGFALTAEAYREFVRANDLGSLVSAQLEDLTTGFRSMIDVSASIRDLVLPANLPDRVRPRSAPRTSSYAKRAGPTRWT